MSDAPPPTAVTARYLRRFACRGQTCEDTCCQTWQIPVDEQQHQRLTAMLGDDAKLAVERDGSGILHLKLLPDGTCAFLAPDRLCSLQIRHGEPALPQVCSTYPRDILKRDHGAWEVWASVSCPEIARLCLLAPDALELVEAPADITSRWVTTRAEASATAYARPFADVRATVLRVLSLRQHPMRTRLFLLAYLGRETSAFFHKDAAAVDTARLQAALAEVTEPAVIAHWERELAAMPAPRGLTGNLVSQLADARATLQASSFHGLVEAALGSYRAGGVVPDPLGLPRIDPVALWAEYAERRAAWQAAWAVRIDLAFENYAKNFWLRESYTRSVDLLAHARRLLVRVAVLRFLLFSHPALVAAQTADPAAQGEALDRVAVEVFYKVARAVEHQSNFLDRIASTVVRDGLQTFAHSTFLVLV